MKKIILGASLLCLVGCAHTPMVWNKSGVTIEDFRRDKYECVQQSRTSWSGGGGGLIGIAIMIGSQANAQDKANKMYGLCMEAKGYDGHAMQEGEQVRK